MTTTASIELTLKDISAGRTSGSMCSSSLVDAPWDVDASPGYGPGASLADPIPAASPRQGEIPQEYRDASAGELRERIIAAKAALGDRVVVLGHHYQRVEVVEHADYIGALRQAAPGAAVVHASTRQFYGRPQYLPVDERHPVVPPDANGVSKFAGEQYWLLEGRVQGRPVASLRLTNCYGPRLRIRDARQTFLGIWIRRVLEGEPFEVWGGEQLRDLAYADDVVAGFLAAAETLLGPAPERCAGRAFNIGGDAPVSLLRLAELLVDAAGQGSYEIRSFPPDRAAIDIGSYHADDRAFREATGWAPRVPLAEGLRRSVAWFRPRLADYIQP